jgi:hypothetical protein
MTTHVPILRAATLALICALATCVLAVEAQQVIEIDGARIQVQGNGPVAVEVQANGERRIFVPEPKGADETLDENADRQKEGQGDVVTTTGGDRIVGKVLTIEGDGRLRLTSPRFEGELIVKPDGIGVVELTPEVESDGPDRLALTNDDLLVGDVVAISPENVVVESKATGPLRISRKIVTDIAFAQTNPTVLESHFDKGKLEPWQKRGAWSVANGAAQHSTHGRQTLFAEFPQEEAMTMEVKIQATMHRYINCEMILFADTTDGAYGRNSVIARVYSSNYYIMYSQNGNTHNMTNLPSVSLTGTA